MNTKRVDYTYKNNLCCSCGMCIGICPTNAIQYVYDKYGYLKPEIDEKKCINCYKCINLCPGNNFFVIHDSKLQINQDVYYDGNSINEEIRFNSASGGLTTELLLYLLEKSIVDECVVVDTIKDINNIHAIITSDVEIIKNSKGSKYCPVPLGEIIPKLNKNKRYAIVALPCQIQVLSKLFKNKRENIVLISLFCNHCSSINATKFICENVDIEIDEFYYRGNGWPSDIQIKSKNNERLAIPFRSMYLKTFGKYFYNERCRYCNDPFGILSDISVADAFHKDKSQNGNGKTLCFVHSEKINNYLLDMKNKNKIQLDKVDSFKDIIKHFPSQKNRTYNTISYIKSIKKYGKNKIKLPYGYENVLNNTNEYVKELNFSSYVKLNLKILLCRVVSSKKYLWKFLFKIKNHDREIRKL